MSKLMNAFLTQNRKNYGTIIAVDLSIKKAMSTPKSKGCDVWEIFLDMDDVWGLYKTFKKNPIFNLYVVYSTTDANKKPLIEIISGKMEITDIYTSRNGGPHSVKGISIDLKFSSKGKNDREKVQFD